MFLFSFIHFIQNSTPRLPKQLSQDPSPKERKSLHNRPLKYQKHNNTFLQTIHVCGPFDLAFGFDSLVSGFMSGFFSVSADSVDFSSSFLALSPSVFSSDAFVSPSLLASFSFSFPDSASSFC